MASAPSSATTDRPLRADARRNREKIVAAALTCFGAAGADTQVDDVARAAGVGVGTLYRHFPTKEALLGAVAAEWFGHLADGGERARAEDPPGEGFFSFIEYSATFQAESRGLSDLFFGSPELKAGAADQLDRLHAASAALVERAQEAGTLRPDFQPSDVPLMMCGLGRIQTWSGDRAAWRRHLDFVIAGLRAG
jgi:AcrR family transcriptional regulator